MLNFAQSINDKFLINIYHIESASTEFIESKTALFTAFKYSEELIEKEKVKR